MARGKRKQVVKEEKVVEQVKEEKKEEPVIEKEVNKHQEEYIIEEKKEEEKKVPQNLNEYVQEQVKQQQKKIEDFHKNKAICVRNIDGSIGVSVKQPQVRKGRLLNNTVVSNSINGWQRTLLQGSEVEIVADLGSKITIKAYGMLHTIASKYIEKL